MPQKLPEKELERAARILRAGGLVAFPTETVYGLGADAANPEAVKKIFAAKGRPADHPLIVHLPSAAFLPEWAKEVPNVASRLAEAFWPGPLTLILPKAQKVLGEITGAQDTVALRVPNHPLALALLERFGGGIAAPSANRFGRLSPTRAEHVQEELEGAVDLVLDGGPCTVGVESTILDLSGEKPRLLRPGGISLKQLGEVLGVEPVLAGKEGPRAPGRLESHYAPATPLILVDSVNLLDEVDRLKRLGLIAVLARQEKPADLDVSWTLAPQDPEAYAQGLYASLRELDSLGCRWIVVEKVPEDPDWLAVHDRLRRAAGSGR